MKHSYLVIFLVVFFSNLQAQEVIVQVTPTEAYQTIDGFGAALAYYENWLTTHPNKSEIYEAVFGELSLDFLRVRNAYGYDNGMVGRVKEFIDASETVRGTPIPFLTTSWGPPAYLKSNNSRSNGGTLKYTLSDGKVAFDYDGFANWWNESIDDYEANGISPSFVSIQNEPDWKASYESCLLNPFEKVNSSDTLAGYNIALETVYNKLQQRANPPRLLGPETIGIGYNAVKNYVLQLDTTMLAAVAHHLYHGIDVENPWDNTEMADLRERYPKLKFYQTEYSGSDWFNLSGLMYKSFVDEQVAAYFYWDLVWDNGGLVSLDNPWNKGSWSNDKGYTKTKLFYAFKQFSAFVQPGWKRVEAYAASSAVEAVAFMSPAQDSLSVVVINRSTGSAKDLRFDLADFEFAQSDLYTTSVIFNCEQLDNIDDLTATVPIKSISTAFFTKTFRDGVTELETKKPKVYPNPFREMFLIESSEESSNWQLFTLDGSLIKTGTGKQVHCSELKPGTYLLKADQQIMKVIKK